MDDASPLRHLGPADRRGLLAHFLALGPEDRRLRFGIGVSDESVEDYVDRINYGSDCVFGVHESGREEPLAVIHVARTAEAAELGLSVLPGHRGKGLGGALLRRAIAWLRSRGILSVCVHSLAENAAMMRLARANGMRITYSGAEGTGCLDLEAPSAA